MDTEQDQPDVPDGRGVTDGLVDEIGIVEESVRLDELADGDQIDVRVGDPNIRRPWPRPSNLSARRARRIRST